ncbi:hypothetical protein D3C87_1034070 [compost metagenome]
MNRFQDALAPAGTRDTVELGEEVEVLVARQRPVRGKQLRHIANVLTHLHGLVDDVEAGHPRRPRGRRQERDEHPDERALSRPVWAQQTKDRPGRHVKAHVVHRHDVPKAAGQVRDLDRPLRSPGSLRRARCSHASPFRVSASC